MKQPSTLHSMKHLYIKAKKSYYNGNKKPILTDAAFDRLENQIRKLDPDWAELAVTGVKVADKKTEVALVEPMPSLNKAYPEAISKWVAKNPSDDYMVTDKLDGASLQVVYDGGKLSQVVTRGNGVLGGDISFLAPKLNLPRAIKSKSRTVFRCEAVMTKENFQRWKKHFQVADIKDSEKATGNNSADRRAITASEISALAEFKDLTQDYKTWKRKYQSHVDNAIAVGKRTDLSFKQYLRLAQKAGVTTPEMIGKKPKLYQLARYGDMGPYTIGNCRFVTMAQNQKELTANLGRRNTIAASVAATERYFVAISPDGKTHKSKNLHTFSDKHGLNFSNLHSVFSGKRPHHKGWTGYFVEPDERLAPKLVAKKDDTESFVTARNMVNGLLNRKTAHKALVHVDIVVLGCYGLSIKAGLNLAKMEGLHTVALTGITARQATPEGLTDLLETRLSKSLYDMDGLVVAPTDFKLVYPNADKPKGIVAFKVNADADAVQVTVESIIWQVSRTGRIIPKIRIADTVIGDVTVNHATAHNAKWMVDRKIGPGAVLKVVRSGGVIPKIVGVTKPAKKLSLPTIPYTQVGVHFEVAQDRADGRTQSKIELEQLVKFLGTIGIEFLASKTIAKLQWELPIPYSYVCAWHEKRLADILIESGVGALMTKKIVAEFDRVFGSTVSMRQLMVASQCFGVGIGDRRLRQLEDAGISMRWLSQADEDAVDARVSKVAGWSDKTVALLISGLPKWENFYISVCSMITIDGSLPRRKKPSVNAGPLKGQLVSFTGYRDKAHEAAVEAAGGEIVPFGSKTTILLIKAGGKASTKVGKAKAMGIRVCSFADLKL